MNLLRAALERAAATMSGKGLVAPMPFGGPGMMDPTAMASQRQPGMQPTPNAQVADRFGGMQSPDGASFAERFGNMDPAVLAKGDMLQAAPNQAVANRGMPMMAHGVPMPQPRPQMAQHTPMPQPRPAEAPQPMGFFQRNAAMMTDPVTGMFIDPGAAAQAQAGGGDIIKKMLGLLHNKANNA